MFIRLYILDLTFLVIMFSNSTFLLQASEKDLSFGLFLMFGFHLFLE